MQNMEETPKAKALRLRLQRQGLPAPKLDYHDLDDVEFYTELADAFDEFRGALRRGQPTRSQISTIDHLPK